MPRQINDSGFKLIKFYEGLSLSAYRDIAGHLTIGYGHKSADITEGMSICEDQAEDLLRSDLQFFEAGIDKLLAGALNLNQFSALVSFAYNLGLYTLRNSTLYSDIQAGDLDLASDQFLVWNHCKGVVVAGLAARRVAEKALFDEPLTE